VIIPWQVRAALLDPCHDASPEKEFLSANGLSVSGLMGPSWGGGKAVENNPMNECGAVRNGCEQPPVCADGRSTPDDAKSPRRTTRKIANIRMK
jgi:hypothetical protein